MGMPGSQAASQSVRQAGRQEATLTRDGEQHGAVHQLFLGDEHFATLGVADWREREEDGSRRNECAGQACCDKRGMPRQSQGSYPTQPPASIIPQPSLQSPPLPIIPSFRSFPSLHSSAVTPLCLPPSSTFPLHCSAASCSSTTAAR